MLDIFSWCDDGEKGEDTYCFYKEGQPAFALCFDDCQSLCQSAS